MLRRHGIGFSVFSSILALLAGGALAEAGTITFSSSAPMPGGFDQAQPTNTGVGNNTDGGANSIELGRPYLGQTFLVPTSVGAGGATLNSFSVHVTNYSDFSGARTFEARVVQISGDGSTSGTPDLPPYSDYPNDGPTYTTLATDTATAAAQGNFVDEWLTFNFASLPVLAAGNTYGFAFRATDGSGFGDLGYSEDTSYTNGRAFTIDTVDPIDSTITPSPYAYGRGFDRQFVANIVAVPEPATLGLAGLAAAGMLARRRRAN